jgi:energy-coupling factor transporter transmembrane protein EcfT
LWFYIKELHTTYYSINIKKIKEDDITIFLLDILLVVIGGFISFFSSNALIILMIIIIGVVLFNMCHKIKIPHKKIIILILFSFITIICVNVYFLPSPSDGFYSFNPDNSDFSEIRIYLPNYVILTEFDENETNIASYRDVYDFNNRKGTQLVYLSSKEVIDEYIKNRSQTMNESIKFSNNRIEIESALNKTFPENKYLSWIEESKEGTRDYTHILIINNKYKAIHIASTDPDMAIIMAKSVNFNDWQSCFLHFLNPFS